MQGSGYTLCALRAPAAGPATSATLESEIQIDRDREGGGGCSLKPACLAESFAREPDVRRVLK